MPTPTTEANLSERFWSKVRKTETCWWWTGAHDHPQSAAMIGYGLFWVGGRYLKAHRVSRLLAHGREPADLVCHHCDNPRCIRPDHLFEGTHASNAADKVKKNRQQRLRGEAHGRARLTSLAVAEMRRLYVPRKTPFRNWAERYGVTIAAIHAAVRGKNWRHSWTPKLSPA